MPHGTPPKITPLRDGPLALEENDAADPVLVMADGEPHPARGPHMLCRCGGSESKPFCDGTHMSNGFSSENLSKGKRGSPQDFEGAEIVVHDNRRACAHAKECIHGAPATFHEEGRPWVTPDADDADLVAEVIRRCPSGALAYRLRGTEWRDEERPPRVRVVRGGPYNVEGGITLAVEEDAWPEAIGREHYSLCRCGGSRNKPFCDGTHWHNGFAESGE